MENVKIMAGIWRENHESMGTNKKKMPAGVWIFVAERALHGILLMIIALGWWQAVRGKWSLWLLLLGILLLMTAVGVARRRWWGWLLSVIEAVGGIAGGVVGMTYAALSFPAGLGRGWLWAFIAVAVVSFAALIAMLAALAQAQSYFKESEQYWRVEKWNRVLAVSVIALVVVRVAVGGVVVKNIGALRTAGEGVKTELEQAIGYCDGLGAGTQKDSCYLQVAVAAGEQGDALPADFCMRVSPAQPQLKFLCIAYARQIESCDAFEAARERALCRGLVSGNVRECAALDASEQDVCINTVNGYLETLRNEGEAGGSNLESGD
jgi:hypothetical protein